jgi:hypothetical protein
MRHRAAIEAAMFSSIWSLFNLELMVTLYDLTNTYFEAEAAVNPKAQYGRSKEKRTNCPLVTLGQGVDGSGFVRHSQTFASNVAEAGTLESMLRSLGALPGAGANGNSTPIRRRPSRPPAANCCACRRPSARMARKLALVPFHWPRSEGNRDGRAFLPRLRGGIEQDRRWTVYPGNLS